MAEAAVRDPARRARTMSLIEVGEDAGDAAGPVPSGVLLGVGGLPAMLGVRMALEVVTEIYAAVLLPARWNRPAGSEPVEREREVLRLVSEGLSNRQVARRLEISETTARAHLAGVPCLRSETVRALRIAEQRLAEARGEPARATTERDDALRARQQDVAAERARGEPGD